MKTEKRFVVLLWIGLLTIATSCEDIFLKEVEVEDAAVENRLVVQAFISPQDSLIKVEVRYAEPAIGIVELGEESSSNVRDAIVTLQEGNTKVTLLLEDFERFYFIRKEAFPISAGKTYTLKVNVPDYLQATATCTVPKSRVDTSKVEIITIGDFQQKVVLSWEDISNETNYYNLFSLRMREDSLGNLEMERNSNSIGVYTDSLNDGGLIFSDSFSPRNVTAYDGYKFYPLVLLANVDYHYYEFHRTLEGQTLSGDILSGIPLSIYSNIEGGFGVFAAYNGILFAFE